MKLNSFKISYVTVAYQISLLEGFFLFSYKCLKLKSWLYKLGTVPNKFFELSNTIRVKFFKHNLNKDYLTWLDKNTLFAYTVIKRITIDHGKHFLKLKSNVTNVIWKIIVGYL